jgi:hypothetical protein
VKECSIELGQKTLRQDLGTDFVSVNSTAINVCLHELQTMLRAAPTIDSSLKQKLSTSAEQHHPAR